MSVAVFAVILAVSLFGMEMPADEVYSTNETSITALSDSTGMSGSYFLGNGNVKSHMYYYYLTANEDGSKEIHQIKSAGVKVFDDEAKNPHITTITKRNSNPIIRFFFLDE